MLLRSEHFVGDGVNFVFRYPTVEEEFEFATYALNDRLFYNSHGYKNVVYPSELWIENNRLLFERFKSDFDINYYNEGLKKLLESLKYLLAFNMKMQRMCAFSDGIEYPSLVEIVTIRYGSGGRYAPEESPPKIFIRVNERGETVRPNGVNTLIHEYVHILIHKIIKQESIQHALKETLVDFIVSFVNNPSMVEFSGTPEKIDEKLLMRGEILPMYELQPQFYTDFSWSISLLNHLGIVPYIQMISAQ